MIDYLIVGVIAVSAVIGLFRGFFPELISLLSWIVAIWSGWNFSGLVEPYLALRAYLKVCPVTAALSSQRRMPILENSALADSISARASSVRPVELRYSPSSSRALAP